jgi:hypothetical protein
MKPQLHLEFSHSWTADILDRRPQILPARQFVYPRQAEEVERGALELLVRPATGPEFLATCALGFADPSAPSGVWSCPNPDWLCAAAGGYAYLIDTTHPEQWQQVEYRPVLEVRPLVEHELLLFVGHHSLLAWEPVGQAWQTARLSSEGVIIHAIDGSTLRGSGWDLRTDKEFEFSVDLRTGQHKIADVEAGSNPTGNPS